MSFMPPLDLVALLACWGLWLTFGHRVDRPHLSPNSLTAAVTALRLEWMTRICERDNRIVDSGLMNSLINSVSFFASATVLILGGVAAMAGNADHSFAIIQAIPFVPTVTKELFEIKLFILGLIFVYSFFKFTWSLRQYTYCCVLIGAAPMPEAAPQEREAFAHKAARVNQLGARSFNQGLRGYYFALAVLAWFLHPVAFVGATLGVVGILWRREFHSRTRRALWGHS